MDAFKTILFPLNTESAMKKIEEINTLVFVVNRAANKRQIKAAIKQLYEVDALKIRTLIRLVISCSCLLEQDTDIVPFSSTDLTERRRHTSSCHPTRTLLMYPAELVFFEQFYYPHTSIIHCTVYR
jgi:hypothetical protein